MGYYVTIIDADFTIPRDKVDDAFEVLCALNQRDELKGGYHYFRGEVVERYFKWMPADYDKTATSLADVLDMLGFDIETGDDGAVSIVGYDNKGGDEPHFIEALAPYATPGSFLNWEGEERELWRQEVADDGTIRDLVGDIVWT